MNPTFLIAGERRCGTTSLYHWMSSHPEVYLHTATDMNYFVEAELNGRTWRDGEIGGTLWERSHTPDQYSDIFRSAKDVSAIGHKGADLFFWQPAHSRIARYLPDVKFIVTLRNPVARAWSQYWNEVGKGREALSFEGALQAEEERCQTSAYARFHLSYLRRGFFDESLERFLQHVPLSRLLVITVEQSHAHPRETLKQIYDFIGIDPTRGIECAGKSFNRNWTLVPRDWAKLPVVRTVERLYARAVEAATVRVTKDAEKRRAIRKYAHSLFRKPAGSISMPSEYRVDLTEVYTPHVRRLEAMLNRQFPEWGL